MKIAERVMNNCYYGDGTVHPGDHLLFLHELCELFKCAGISMDEVRKKLFSISLRGKAAEWYKLLKNGRSIGWEEIIPLFYSKFYPPSEIHKYRNQIYNFWPHDGESTAQAWGRLKSLMLKCPFMSSLIILSLIISMQGFLFMIKIYWMLLVLDHSHV